MAELWRLALASLTCLPACTTDDTPTPERESAAPVECVDIPQVASDNKPSEQSSGFEYCYTADAPGDGFINRVAAATCVADPAGFHMACDGQGYSGSTCQEHTDCGAGGFCEINYEKGGTCACIPLCTKDSDCGAEQVCICPAALDLKGYGVGLGAYGECVAASCLSPLDCDGNDCGLGIAPCHGATGTFCRDDSDACRSSADCDGQECARYSAKDAWACTKPMTCE